MESITKPKVTQEQLRAICSEHLNEELREARELKDGWFNAAYLLVGEGGSEAVLKIAPPDSVRVMRYERDLMTAEVGSLRLIQERTSIPTPAVIAYRTNRQIVDCDYFLAERVKGTPLNLVRESLSEQIQADIDHQIGAHLRELHTVHASQFGTFNQPVHARWKDAFGEMMNWLRQDATDLAVELPPGAFDSVGQHISALDEVEMPSLVHWDLWDANIFVDPDSGTVTGLIDFERALWGDPLIEPNFHEAKSAFLGAYGQEILEAPGARTRRFLYQLYLHLIMVIECRFRHFTAEHETWCRGLLDNTIAGGAR